MRNHVFLLPKFDFKIIKQTLTRNNGFVVAKIANGLFENDRTDSDEK